MDEMDGYMISKNMVMEVEDGMRVRRLVFVLILLLLVFTMGTEMEGRRVEGRDEPARPH